MRRTTLAIGVALALGAAHASNAIAQEDNAIERDDEFEVTLDVVLDDVEDIDGVVMSVIEDERERSEMEEEFAEERELEARLRDEEAFIERDGEDADEYDDGQFDEYDDGEEIETGEDEPLEETPELDETVDEVIEEPGMDEPNIEEPVVEEPGMDEPNIEEPVIEEPVVDEAGMDGPGLDALDVV